MRRLLLMAFFVSWSHAAVTQVLPDFSGKWAGGQPMVNLYGVVGPTEMTITQDAKTLSIERTYGSNRVVVVVKLDGSESKNVLNPGVRPGVPNFDRVLFSTATWKGTKLEIVTKSSFPVGQRTENAVTIETLSRAGADLVVERNDAAFGANFNSADALRSGVANVKRLIYKNAAK